MDYFLCCWPTFSALRNQSTAIICRPYSSSNKEYMGNKEYMDTIRKSKISYFIINISMTSISLQVDCIKQMLELCMHIQHINNQSDLIRSLKFRAKIFDITTQQHIGFTKYSQTFINIM